MGQGWTQIGELALAFALSSLIGLEREWAQKSAGLRTHTLVGVGSAPFVLVSKYGFTDVLGSHVVPAARGGPAELALHGPAPAGRVRGRAGVLRDVLAECTERGFAIVRISTRHLEEGTTPAVAADLELQGQPVVERLAVALTDLDGVIEVTTTDLGSD